MGGGASTSTQFRSLIDAFKNMGRGLCSNSKNKDNYMAKLFHNFFSCNFSLS